MKPLKPREVEYIIAADGWYRVKSKGGSHRKYRHPTKKGLVIIPWHNRDLKKGTLENILRQAQIETK